MRVVFDTNTIISALLFPRGQLSWIRRHWPSNQVTPFLSNETATEIIRVLSYAKFQLDKHEVEALLSDFLPFAETVSTVPVSKISKCRDPDDQIFIDLAVCGQAAILVTGDKDLLDMDIDIVIETPAQYKKRWPESVTG